MTCGMVAEQYCTLVSHKLAVARFHLDEFEKLINRETAAVSSGYPEVRYAAFHGHADGAVFEAFAAFDTYSCALAHKFGVPQADRASFKLISESKIPADIAQRVAETTATAEWKRLESLRDLAGHRGVVSESMRWGRHLKGGFQVHLPDGAEALPVITSLLDWAEQRLLDLFSGVCEREKSILRNRLNQTT